MRRILITGSRRWNDWALFDSALLYVKTSAEDIIVHGACPTGADRMAERWADANGVHTEPHPADWTRGRGAGPERNQVMVDLGADVCLAFHLPGSRGTDDCVRRAQRAGIRVILFDWR